MHIFLINSVTQIYKWRLFFSLYLTSKHVLRNHITVFSLRFVYHIHISTVLGPNQSRHIYLWLISANNPLLPPLLLPLKIAFKSILMMSLVTNVTACSLITRIQNIATLSLGQSYFSLIFCLGYQQDIFWVLPPGTGHECLPKPGTLFSLFPVLHTFLCLVYAYLIS